MRWLLTWEKKDEQRKTSCVFKKTKKTTRSKDETDGIQITNVLTSMTENVTSVKLTYVEEEMQKTSSARKNIKSKFLRKLRKKLACIQKTLVLL